MSQFVTLANNIKELGVTVVVLAAIVWASLRFFPKQLKQQGELEEILRNNRATIEACTEALRMVTARGNDTKEVLVRCESKLEEILKHQNEIMLELRGRRRN